MRREDRNDTRDARPGGPDAVDPAVDPADERFARRLAELYAPEPRSSEERLAFTRRLEARIERRRRQRWLPALMGAGAVAAVAVLVLLRVPDPGLSPDAVDASGLSSWSARDVQQEGDWEMQLLYPEVLLEAGSSAVSDASSLPADYAAIGSVFLGE